MTPLLFLAMPFLAVVALLFVLSRLIVASASRDRRARVLDGGRLEFAPEQRAFWAAYVFLGFLVLVALSSLVASILAGRFPLPTLVCVGFITLLLLVLPGTVVLTEQGLEQQYWLRQTQIAWDAVRDVVVDEKQERVIVYGKQSGKIVHMRTLPDRARLLAELKARCPDKMPHAEPRHFVVPPPDAPLA